MSKKSVIIIASSVIAVALIAGGFYYYVNYFTQPKLPIAEIPEVPTEDLKDPARIEKIVAFTVKSNSLTAEQIAGVQESFIKLTDFFRQHQGEIISYETLMRMAALKQAVGDYEGARDIYLYVYQLDPNGYLVQGNLAALDTYELHNYAEAEKFYHLAITKAESGNLLSYYQGLIEVYKTGFNDNEKAKAAIAEAIDRLPTSITMQITAAEFYKSIGDKKTAMKYYQNALAIDPTSEAAKVGLESLSK